MRGVREGGAVIGTPTLVYAIADALAPFDEVAVDLPLTPVKSLSVIAGGERTRPATAAGPLASTKPPLAAPASAATIPAAEPPAPSAAPRSEPEPVSARIDGDWNMVLASPVGPQEMLGHFETQGDRLTGYLRSPEGQQDFTGTVDGKQLKFDLKVEKPMKITLKYDITIEGET